MFALIISIILLLVLVFFDYSPHEKIRGGFEPGFKLPLPRKFRQEIRVGKLKKQFEKFKKDSAKNAMVHLFEQSHIEDIVRELSGAHVNKKARIMFGVPNVHSATLMTENSEIDAKVRNRIKAFCDIVNKNGMDYCYTSEPLMISLYFSQRHFSKYLADEEFDNARKEKSREKVNHELRKIESALHETRDCIATWLDGDKSHDERFFFVLLHSDNHAAAVLLDKRKEKIWVIDSDHDNYEHFPKELKDMRTDTIKLWLPKKMINWDVDHNFKKDSIRAFQSATWDNYCQTWNGLICILMVLNPNETIPSIAKTLYKKYSKLYGTDYTGAMIECIQEFAFYIYKRHALRFYKPRVLRKLNDARSEFIKGDAACPSTLDVHFPAAINAKYKRLMKLFAKTKAIKSEAEREAQNNMIKKKIGEHSATSISIEKYDKIRGRYELMKKELDADIASYADKMEEKRKEKEKKFKYI